MIIQYVTIRGNVSNPAMAVSSDGPQPPNVDNLRYRSERYGVTYEMTSTAPALLLSAMKVIRVSTTLLTPYVSDDD
jgi:hypothetical protein